MNGSGKGGSPHEALWRDGSSQTLVAASRNFIGSVPAIGADAVALAGSRGRASPTMAAATATGRGRVPVRGVAGHVARLGGDDAV